MAGIRIPSAVNHAPLPVMPFLPRIINSPEMASRIRAAAKISENQVHSFLGLL